MSGREEEIKEVIRSYIETESQIKELSKDVKELKDVKKGQEESLLEFMKEQGLGEITLKNGSKIKCVKSKSLEPMNKDFILSALAEELGDESKASLFYEKMNEKRAVTEKECIKKTK